MIKVFAKTFDDATKEQTDKLGQSEAYRDCEIRVMPDAHAGAGCTIGTVIQIKDKVVPETVGVDIGCGMTVVKLGMLDLDLKRLDEIINECVPAGFCIHEKPVMSEIIASKVLGPLVCPVVDKEQAWRAMGSLGGGNHFIEVDTDESGFLYLVIHSGSRNAGKRVCEYYQEIANRKLFGKKVSERKEVIDRLKAECRTQEIQDYLRKMGPCKVDKDLAYLEGEDLENYLHDMKLMTEYASWNRYKIWSIIRANLGINDCELFETVHNYIDVDASTIRKGAVSAQAGEELIIPMNMRDGSLLCTGKGNPEWLCSAPHGAGRIMSRAEAYRKLTMEEFTEEMEGIYSTSICQATIDESPMAYKPTDEIIAAVEPTVTINKIIKPIYNFKAKEQTPIWKIFKDTKKSAEMIQDN